jgi:hypothetical protein
MKCTTGLALLVVALARIIAGEASGVISSVSPMGQADGKAFCFHVSDAVVKTTPVWTSGATCPPLEPRRAIEIATKQLHQLVKEPAKWYFHEISLVDFGDHVHWVYVASFYREYPADLAVFGMDNMEIPVLMSGAIVKPEVVQIPPDRVEPVRPNQSLQPTPGRSDK